MSDDDFKNSEMPEDSPRGMSGRTFSAGMALLAVGIASGVFVIVNMNIQNYTVMDYVGPIGLSGLGGYFIFQAFDQRDSKD